MSAIQLIKKYWKTLIVAFTPFVFVIIPVLASSQAGRCAYVIITMAIYWMTEALPLPVTALIPVFAFPLLGITSTEKLCRIYMKGTTMMFLGGLAVATAVEHCNLHRRIALFVILHVGQSPKRLLAGFMITSMFLSMWISNTACTAMMIPVVDAILQELFKHNSKSETKQIEDLSIAPHHQSQLELVELPQTPKKSVKVNMEKHNEIKDNNNQDPDEESRALSTMYLLGTAYAASIGGTGFPTGTGPNLVLWELMDEWYRDTPTGLDFLSWMLFTVPCMLLCTAFTWVWLQFLCIGFGKWRKISESSKEKEQAVKALVEKQYKSLGKITFHETTVLSLFLAMVLLWIFRKPEFISGWGEQIENLFVYELTIGNATPAIFILVLLFIIPSKPNFWPFISLEEDLASPVNEACLTWDVMQHKLPWGLLILIGGGFALAEGAASSGLSIRMGEQLIYLSALPAPILVFSVSLIISFLTEVLTNITAASVLIPVLRELANKSGLNPLYLIIPSCLTCSYAFMLPVSNPPNAIAYNASNMTIMDMMKAGVVVKLACVIIMTVMLNTLGIAIFDVHNLPLWAISHENATHLNLTVT